MYIVALPPVSPIFFKTWEWPGDKEVYRYFDNYQIIVLFYFQCPVNDLLENARSIGIFQTMSTSSFLTVDVCTTNIVCIILMYAGIPPEQNSIWVLNNIHRFLIKLWLSTPPVSLMLIQLAQSQTGWPTLIQVCWGKHCQYAYTYSTTNPPKPKG